MSDQSIYRPIAPGELLTGAQLAGAKVAIETAHGELHPRHELHAKFCCGGDCHVNEVVIRAKWPNGDRPPRPKFTCPGCGGTLEFRELLKETTLVPVAPQSGTDPTEQQVGQRQANRIIAAELRGDLAHLTLTDDIGNEHAADVPDRAIGSYAQMKALLAANGVQYRELHFEIGRRPDGSPRAWKKYIDQLLAKENPPV